MSLEREVKLQAPAGFRLPDLSADGVAANEAEPRRLTTVYHDTPDLRLARWGCSLRHRNGEGWTLKLPAGEQGALFVRREIVFEGDPRRPPAEAVDLVRGYVRSATLSAVARLRTLRRATELRGGGGDPVAVVTDDEVSVMDGSRVASRFRELEVELAEAGPSRLVDEVVGRLRRAGAGPVQNVPKLVRALGARAEEPPDVVAPGLGPEATTREVVRRALAASVVRLLRNDAGVRLGEYPEDVHQARVSTRRLRSDLRTFRGVLEPTWPGPLRDELRWLGGELGAVRDAEVLRDRLRALEAAIPEGDLATAERLIARLERRREQAREGLLASMREERYVRLLDRLVESSRDPEVLAEAADVPAARALRPVLEGPWEHLREAIERVAEDPSDELLHAARIRAKRVRYASEAVAPVFGKPAKGFAQAAIALQDVLGEHQDAVVASAWLRETARRSGSSQAFVAGELAALEAQAAAAARAAWPAAWKKLSRKRLRFWA